MTAAADVYEIVLHDTTEPLSWLQRLMSRLRRVDPSDPGGVIISVRNKKSGAELFRHIEDGGDDEDHLLHRIQQDLGSMTAAEFKATWGR